MVYPFHAWEQWPRSYICILKNLGSQGQLSWLPRISGYLLSHTLYQCLAAPSPVPAPRHPHPHLRSHPMLHFMRSPHAVSLIAPFLPLSPATRLSPILYTTQFGALTPTPLPLCAISALKKLGHFLTDTMFPDRCGRNQSGLRGHTTWIVTQDAKYPFTNTLTHLSVRQVGAGLQHNVHLLLEGSQVRIFQLALWRVQLLLQGVLGIEGVAVAHQRVDSPAPDVRPHVCLHGEVADAGGLQQRLPPGWDQRTPAGWWSAVPQGMQCTYGMSAVGRLNLTWLQGPWERGAGGDTVCCAKPCMLQQHLTLQRAASGGVSAEPHGPALRGLSLVLLPRTAALVRVWSGPWGLHQDAPRTPHAAAPTA